MNYHKITFLQSKYYIQVSLFSSDLMKGRERAYPNDNYLSGDGKSMVWSGHSYYNPTNRSWQKHHEVRSVPNDRVPGQIEFQNEDSWREWQGRRDRPGSKLCASSGMYP